MKETVFTILDQINREGISNDSWSMVELNNRYLSEYFGPGYDKSEDVKVNGKYLALWVSDADGFSFIRTETYDLCYSLGADKNDHCWCIFLWEC